MTILAGKLNDGWMIDAIIFLKCHLLFHYNPVQLSFLCTALFVDE